MSDNVIKNPVPKNFQKKTETIAQVNNGAIGTAEKELVKEEKLHYRSDTKKEYNKVAVYSSKSVSWPGVGKVLKGYNIVPRESLEKWLTRDHVREATPQEIAEEFGL